MSELRKDPIVSRWVVMAPERANRPIELQTTTIDERVSFNPFAEGHESETPGEILACRDPGTEHDQPGWRVRVVPNKFPALHLEPDGQGRGAGLFESMTGFGSHEVIIECPQFETNLSRLSVQNIREVVWVYRERLKQLKQDPRFAHATIFKNKGLFAGASLPHSHSQLIATPVIPITVQEEMAAAFDYFQRTGRSIFDDLIEQERADRRRVVLETSHFIVICPYASRFPYELWILPRGQKSHFETIVDAELAELGSVLKTTLQKLEMSLNDPAYNYVIHTAPLRDRHLPHYSWHIEILPRTTQVAGFEWGSGFYINPVYPEVAADRLRQTAVD